MSEESNADLSQEAVERTADEGDAGKPPEGAVMAIKDVRYLGAGVKISNPDPDGFQAITFLIDSRTQNTYIFGPETAAYLHEKTLSPEARALLTDIPDAAAVDLKPEEPSE